MKLLKNKVTGEFRIQGFFGSTKSFRTKAEATRDYYRVRRNYLQRQANQAVRDIIGGK